MRECPVDAYRPPISMMSETGSSFDVKQAVEQGNLLLAHKNFDAAKEIFSQARAALPDNPEVLLGLCRVAYAQQSWPELHELTARLLAVDPKNAEGCLLRARSCNQARDWAGAAQAWALVSEDRSDWPEAWFQLGRARTRIEDGTGSFEAADRLAALAPRTPQITTLLIRLLIELGALTRAKEECDRLVRVDTSAATQLFAEFDQAKDFRGVAICAGSLFETGGDELEEGFRHGLKTVAARAVDRLLDRAAVHERGGHLEAAYLDHKAVLVLDALEPLSKRTTARILRTLRSAAHGALREVDPAPARTAFMRITQIEPDDHDSWFQLGRSLMRLREWSAAVPVWQKVVEQQPELKEAQLQLARALSRSGREADSLPVWQDILRHDPDHAEAQQMIETMPQRTLANARAAIATGHLREAVQMIRDLKTIDPANDEADARLEHIGRKMLQEMRAAFKLVDSRRVLEFAEDASTLLPEHPEVRLLVGRAAMNRRKYELALPAWQKLAELDPSSAAMCRLQIARCYLRSGQEGKARLAAAEILADEPDNTEAAEMLARLEGRPLDLDPD